MKPATASEAIGVALDALPGLDDPTRRKLREGVLERERLASTGLGHGIALPHPREMLGDLIDEAMVSVIFPDEPLDWAAVDGELVHTIFLLLSPTAAVHLQIISGVAACVRSPGLLGFLRERPGKAKLVERLRALRPAE